MYKYLCLLYFYGNLLSGYAQNEITMKNLEGTWKELEIRIDETFLPTEAVPVRDSPGPHKQTYTSNKHWIFRSGTLSVVAYPCCMSEHHNIVVTSDFLRLMPKDSTRSEDVYTITLRGDTLLAEKFGGASIHYLVRDKLPAQKLNDILAGKVNPVCFHGDWEIPVGEVSVPYDAIVVSYPFKLPAELHINASNQHWYWANNRFYLEVDGVKRPFKVHSVASDEDDMWLIPEKWIKNYKNPEYPEEDAYYSVWLRRIPKE